MDLNGNKCDDKEEDDFNDITNVPNVRSLKLFFQNQKQPVFGFKSSVDNHNDSLSTSNHSEESKSIPVNPSEDIPIIRSHRVMPRPPKSIQSCDIKISPFLKSLVSNQCEGSVQSMSSLPPIPKPRRSLQKNKNNQNSAEIQSNGSSDGQLRTNSLIDSLTKEFKELNSIEINSRTTPFVTNQSNNFLTFDPKEETSGQMVVKTSDPLVPELPVQQIRNKSKKPFKSFKSKLLSLRRISSPNGGKRTKKCQTIDLTTYSTQTKPMKPTRRAPDPPKLHFRPAAPLPPPEPSEDYYEDTLTHSSECESRLTNGYELYNDSVDSERIYCSLDNEDDDQNDSDIYEGIDDYDDGLTHRSDNTYVCDNYYEDNTIDDFDSDSDPIYEVLPFERDLPTDSDSIVSNGSTISLDDNQNQSETRNEVESEVNSKEKAKPEQKLDSFDRKRNLKAIKLKKKFNLNGNEIPVNAGVVKEDHKGNRYDLLVRKGETVLILRMEGNPPGKWLAKNERSKVGFVNLDNISFDAESVKCIIKTLASHKA